MEVIDTELEFLHVWNPISISILLTTEYKSALLKFYFI